MKLIISYNEIDIIAILVECITFMDDITHILKINKLVLDFLQYKAVNLLQRAANYTKYFLNTNNIQLNSKKNKRGGYK